MAPRIEEFEPKFLAKKDANVIPENDNPEASNIAIGKKESDIDLPIVWRNVGIFIFLHLGALYGVYCCFYAAKATLLFAFLMYVAGGLGITAGAHRLWAHRTYKAKLPLRILLGLFQSIALQNSIYEWSRDHRVHHKHTETHADPHNAKRGFFLSHWLVNDEKAP